jgi:hypothetical protein
MKCNHPYCRYILEDIEDIVPLVLPNNIELVVFYSNNYNLDHHNSSCIDTHISLYLLLFIITTILYYISHIHLQLNI